MKKDLLYLLLACSLGISVGSLGCEGKLLDKTTLNTECKTKCVGGGTCSQGKCVPAPGNIDPSAGGGGGGGSSAANAEECNSATKPCTTNGFRCNDTTHKCEAVTTCSVHDECQDSQICLGNKCVTGTRCRDSGDCNTLTEACNNNACIDVTGKVDLCATNQLTCSKGTKCENSTCVPDCDDPCNGVCCASSEVCFKDQRCVAPCPAGEEICDVKSDGTALCCNNTEACVASKCIARGPACNEAAKQFCTIVRYCDKKYQSCIKYEDNTDLCLLPTVDTFHAKVKLDYSRPTYDPASNNVVSLPVVADLTGDHNRPDGWPDIAIITYQGSDGSAPGILRVIRGKTISDDPKSVKEYWQSNRLVRDSARKIEPFWVNPDGSPAIGDLNGDGIPDIVVTTTDSSGNRRGVRAVSGGDGATIFYNGSISGSGSGVRSYSITNLDHQGAPEIIIHNAVLDGETGKVLCTFPNNITPISVDIDEKGNKEIIVGSTAYSFVRTATGARCDMLIDGLKGLLDLAAVADIYPTLPGPEIVTISESTSSIVVSDNSGNKLWSLPLGGSSGGSPTIGDFDGDEKLEIAYADEDYYTIIKPDHNNPHSPGVTMWRKNTKDKSSGFTGSSIFDFDGDGKAEAVYYDEDYLRIYDGKTGDLKLEIDNSSVTGAEYPVIVDVDNDNHADIVVAGNEFRTSHKQTPGLRVITDADNKWVPTRSIWNQHDYHYTNVNDDGTIPVNEKHHWKEEWSNTFRQNMQKGNSRKAPNIVVKLKTLYNEACDSSASRKISYLIENVGDATVPANTIRTVVSASRAGANSFTDIDSRMNTAELAPGKSELVSFDWDVSSSGFAGQLLDIKVVADQGNAVIECHDDDNEDMKRNVSVAASNLIPVVPNSGDIHCPFGSDNVSVSFELHNKGGVPVNIGEAKVKVTLSANIAGTERKFTQTLTNATKIDQNKFEKLTTTIAVDGVYNTSFDVKIEADPDKTVTECIEEDNEYNKAQGVSCLKLG